MPRRSILSAAEKDDLLIIPDDEDLLIQRYSFDNTDLAIIKDHRGDVNRLGFAVQLSYMRYPGIVLGVKEVPDQALLDWTASQLKIDPKLWDDYGKREQTRREHLQEVQKIFGYKSFSSGYQRTAVEDLIPLALQTDKGITLAQALIESLRSKKILLPSIGAMERVCAQALTQANRQIFKALHSSLTATHKERLDRLLERRTQSTVTWLTWMRQSPGRSNSRQMIGHIERLHAWQFLHLPEGIEKQVHQNRLLKIAREGGQMSSADLAKFEPARRYATLVAIAIESTATVIDEIIDLHDKILGRIFNAAKNKHHQQFQESGRAINNKVQLYGRIGKALVDAREQKQDPFKAIESIINWDDFVCSVQEAQQLAQPDDFDFLHRVNDSYAMLRRYTPELLQVLQFKAAPAAKEVMKGIDLMRTLNRDSIRKISNKAPLGFVKRRWQKLVMTDDGIDRRYYELCLLSELKNALRSGDIWVKGSRQFKDFEEYLVTPDQFSSLKKNQEIPLPLEGGFDRYLENRLAHLKSELTKVNELAKLNDLPDASITQYGLKITPLDASVPQAAQVLINQAVAVLPHIKITELLLEVDRWTNFTRHFSHLKNGDLAKDKTLLLTAILADGINLGLSKMTESCPGTTYAKLSWLQAWHIRDETYSAALGEITNAQLKHPFAQHWGDGRTSSSDGQRFKAGSKGLSTGHINPKYGSEPGRLFYTHISDQYMPFHSKVINVGIRDSTYVLDGLLYHESDLRIEEHYTDTAGFTDHVFALMNLLGFKFAPRIRDLADTKLHVPKSEKVACEYLLPLIGGTLNIEHIREHWDEILRLATSIKQGTVTASLMLRKLGSYPRQNGLAIALRELGRIERTIFILEWLQSVELRRRVNAGLNKGEARNALARAVFFNRLGEIRDRSFEQQRYRASGLNLITAAIVLWNTVYLERATLSLEKQGKTSATGLFQYLSPLGWEHVNLTGDYVWRGAKLGPNKYRPLRPLDRP